MRRFQQVRSISVIGLRGSCWWAAPQLRLLPHHNIAGVGEGRQTYVCPPSSTWDSDKERGNEKLVSWAISDRSSAPGLRVQGRAEN
jgi:hypothetical protein